MTTHLAYTRKGSGEPLVLIHGIGHRRQAWNPVFDRLAEKYDVIAVDLAGFGESEPYPRAPRTAWTTPCDNLEQNFEEWGISKPHVVGNWLGGAISLELGARGARLVGHGAQPRRFFRGFDRVIAFFSLILLKLASYLPAGVVQPTLRSSRGRHLIGRTLFEHGERLSADEFIGDVRPCGTAPHSTRP